MRRWLQYGVIGWITLTIAGSALAQEAPKPDQLKKMYDDALAQLKQAQDRKNELAAENDKLKAKLTELQKQLTATQSQQAEADREIAEFADKTFFLRSHYAAWQEFIHQDPKLQARWKVYLTGQTLSPPRLSDYIDVNWPLNSER